MGELIAIIFVLLYFATVVVIICQSYYVNHVLFRKGNNPYQRICRKCGAHQHMYQSNVKGREHVTWWAEVYPVGDNEDCACHKYASNQDY